MSVLPRSLQSFGTNRMRIPVPQPRRSSTYLSSHHSRNFSSVDLGSSKKLYLMTGMGADERLFYRQKEALGNQLRVLEYIRPLESDEPFEQYAERFAEEILNHLPDHEYYIGGVSFGAMLAFVASSKAQSRPRAVIQIAGAVSPTEISTELHKLADLASSLPRFLLRHAIKKSPAAAGSLFTRYEPNLSHSDRELCISMFNDTDPEFLIWAAQAVTSWPSNITLPEGVKLQRIHGANDTVIPLSRLQIPANFIIPHAGHVPNFTNYAEVNSILQQILHEQ